MNDAELFITGIGIVILELSAIVAFGGLLYVLRDHVEWIRRIAP